MALGRGIGGIMVTEIGCRVIGVVRQDSFYGLNQPVDVACVGRSHRRHNKGHDQEDRSDPSPKGLLLGHQEQSISCPGADVIQNVQDTR